MMTILELHTPQEFRDAFPILKELRPHLDMSSYLDLLATMRQRGYRMFGAFEEDEIVAIVGIEITVNFHQGRHMWVYNLVASSKVRHKGYGSKMMTFVESLAQDEGCNSVALWSGTMRTDAHRFYEDHMHYERTGYVFIKELQQEPELA